MNNRFRVLALALVVLASGCTEDPVSTDDASLNFLDPDPTAPPLGVQRITFNAVQGEDTEVFMWYRSAGSPTDSSKMLRFRIRDDAQIRRPNGTLLAPGQSIPITITVVDPIRLIVDFQPSGLRFEGDDEPADLTMWYLERDHDFNDDGVINATDTTIEQQLAIFRRESLSAPWVRLSSSVVVESDEIEAVITGFTNYVIAY